MAALMQARCLRKTLSNGLRVLLLPSKRAPVLSLQVWVMYGSADDSAKTAGLAHLLEHMLFKGTSKRQNGEIALDVSKLGGDINADTSYDRTRYYIDLRAKYLEQGLEILADGVFNSSIKEEDLALEKRVVLEEIKQGNDVTNIRAHYLQFAELFGRHGYARPVIGYAKAVAKLTRAQIVGQYRKHYNARNTFVVISGDFNEAKAMRYCEQYFGQVPRGKPTAVRKAAQPVTKRQMKVIRETSPYATFSLNWLAPNGRHPDCVALDALAKIGDLRLHQKLVVENNQIESIGMGYWSPKDQGSISIDFSGEPGIGGKITKVLPLIKKYLEEPTSRMELERVKKSLRANQLYACATAGGRADRYGFFESLGGVEVLDKYNNDVERLTCERIDEVKRKYLNWQAVTFTGAVPPGCKIPRALPTESKETKTDFKMKFDRKNGVYAYNLRGLRVLIKPMPDFPIFDMAWIGLGGVKLEPAKQAGLGELWSRTAKNGFEDATGKFWSQSQITEEISNCCASLSVEHGRTSWGYYLRGQTEDLPKLCQILLDAKDRPRLSDASIKEAIKRQILGIKAAKDELGGQALQALQDSLYGKHSAAGRDSSGEPAIVKKFKARDLSRYHKKQLAQPQTLSVVGDVVPEEFIRFLAGKLGKQQFPKRTTLLKFKATPKKVASNQLFKKLKKEQSYIISAFPTVNVKHEDRWALSLVAKMLSGMEGRLFTQLREKQSLCYSVGAYHDRHFDGGHFGFIIATSPEKVGAALKALEGERAKMLSEGFSREELKRALEAIRDSQAYAKQDYTSQCSGIALSELYGFGYRRHYEEDAHLLKVTLKEIHRVCKKYFGDSRAHLRIQSIVGPRGAE